MKVVIGIVVYVAIVFVTLYFSTKNAPMEEDLFRENKGGYRE